MTPTLLIALAIAQPFGLWLALRLAAPRVAAPVPAAPPHAEYEICLRAPKCPRVPREFMSGEWSVLP